MTPERYRQIGEIYHAALEVKEEGRAAFLERACAGDEQLRGEVESLIASHEQASNFIATPALAVAAGLLTQQDSRVGQTLGHYRVLSLIGAGGMGEVYLSQDTRLGRRVALKVLGAAFTNDGERMRRFMQEARAASALNHPNILTVHEIGRVNEVDFIATEFIEGETLRPSMGKRRLALTQVLDIAAQVAGALAAAHAAGVVHRDIKPENIMVRPDGYVKVLDFGLAKLAEPGFQGHEVSTVARVETKPGMVMGTVQYMSPEQARGLPMDARTDVWSLGVVLYEMVASHPPFVGETQSDIIVSILEREPARLSLPVTEVSAELERIVTKALTKDKDERYQMVKDMAIDLRRLRRRLEVQAEMERSAQPAQVLSDSDEGSGITSGRQQSDPGQTELQPTARASYADAARRTSSVEYVVSEIKKHRRGAALFGVVLVLLLGSASYGLYKFLRQPRIAAAPFQTTRVTRVTTTGKAKVAAISPDSKYVVYAEEENGQNSLWVKQVATGSSVQIVPPANGFYWGLTFSNDSNYVYYVKNEPGGGPFLKLYQVPSLGGTSRKLMEQVDSAVAFSPDGQRFAFVRDNLKKGETEIVLANGDGTGAQTLATRKAPARFESDLRTRIAWSPDGKVIASAARSTDVAGEYFNVVGVSLEDGSEKPLTSQKWRAVHQVAWRSDGGGLVMIAWAEGDTLAAPQIWHLSYPGGEARRITNDLNSYSDVSLTANSAAIVTVQTDRVSNIWLAPRADPNRARQITTGTNDGNSGLAWTPDGRIVYGSAASGRLEIWMMDADGGNKKQLTHDGENYAPTVSNDGRHIVFTSRRAGRNNVWRMDVDGGNPKQLTNGKINAYGYPSPDGRWVAYVSRDHGSATIWKVSVDGGEPVRLSDPTAQLPIISPDGKRIVCYYWDEQANPPRGAMIIPFDGGPPIKRFYVEPFVLRWTSDSSAVLFIRRSNVWSQPLDGGDQVQVTDFQGDQLFNFDYSPDGKWLAAARGRATTDVVMIEDLR